MKTSMDEGITIIVEGESIESSSEDISEISDRDEDGISFEGMQLAVKEVNTKILSYPDLVHIELSSSCESLSGNNLLNENFSTNNRNFNNSNNYINNNSNNYSNNNSNNYSNKNSTNNNRNFNNINKNRNLTNSMCNRDDDFCILTSSCPDLSLSCCSNFDPSSNKDDGEVRCCSDEFVNITTNELEQYKRIDGLLSAYDCISLNGSRTSLSSQLTRSTSQPDLHCVKQCSTDMEFPADYSTFQRAMSKLTNKVLDLDAFKFQTSDTHL